MRIYRDPHADAISPSSVVSIGNFDGLHLGHLALLQRCAHYRQPHQDLAVVTFDPLPRFHFDRASAPPRLTGPGQRLALLARAGVDLTWMMRFNASLAAMTATDFVMQVLVRGLAATHVVVGDDFRFGRGREGTLGLLRSLGDEHGFVVEVHAPVLVDGQRVSSTVIREALAAGDLRQAGRWLGRPFSLCGRVVRGRQVGRRLGYPTANVRTADGKCPASGVFAVRARLRGLGADGPWQDGVANLGVRPAVGGGEPLLEVHLFDFHGDLYAQRLETRLIGKLREERNFDSLDGLRAQMQEDEEKARALLSATRPEPD